MKVYVVALLCTLAAVQGQSFFDALSEASESPYVVHIRVVKPENNGLLSTCAGSLIGFTWVLTSAECVRNSRFMWLRFGSADVLRPQYLTEGNLVAHVKDGLALVRTNRVIPENDSIRRVSLPEAESEVAQSGQLCIFGAENDAPGNQLSCSNVEVAANEDGSLVANSDASNFDLGAGLVSDGVLVGVLVGVEESSVFASVASNRAWIDEITNL